MLFIVVATKSEAQAFVEYFHLSKKIIDRYKLYANNHITIIISGIGAVNSFNATKKLIKNINKPNIINYGICGGSNSYNIGDTVYINQIIYKNKKYNLNKISNNSILCSNTQIYTDIYPLVDMESYGYYLALKRYTTIDNISIIKTISDHFSPESITKDGVKRLILDELKNNNILKELIIKKISNDKYMI